MEGEHLKDLCVLYVEDDEEVREQLAMLLELWFGKVLVAENGALGLEAFRSGAPDIIISDIQMPVMGGLEMIEDIRKESRIPVILTTAYNEQEHFLGAIRLEINHYIIKPIISDVLLSALIESAKGLEKDRAIARYNDELRQFYERASEELEITRHLMAHMMLTEKFHDDSLRYWLMPTTQFSGDLIAAKRDRDGDLYILVADATGHGLPAAVNLLPLSRIFYAMSEKGFSVSSIVREMNKTLYEQSTRDHFVAATLLRVNSQNCTVEVWNGANPEAYFASHGGEVQQVFESQHHALGILPDHEFRSTTVFFQWEEAGQIWLFSDGLVEATNAEGEYFDEAKVRAVIGANPSMARFTALVEAFRLHLSGQPAEDDVSLVVVDCARESSD